MKDNIKAFAEALDILLDFLDKFFLASLHASAKVNWADLMSWLKNRGLTLTQFIASFLTATVGMIVLGYVIALFGVTLGNTALEKPQWFWFVFVAGSTVLIIIAKMVKGNFTLAYTKDIWAGVWSAYYTYLGLQLFGLVLNSDATSVWTDPVALLEFSRTIIFTGQVWAWLTAIPFVLLIWAGSKLAQVIFNTGKVCAEMTADTAEFAGFHKLAERIKKELEPFRGSESSLKQLAVLYTVFSTIVMLMFVYPRLSVTNGIIWCAGAALITLTIKVGWRIKGNTIPAGIWGGACALTWFVPISYMTLPWLNEQVFGLSSEVFEPIRTWGSLLIGVGIFVYFFVTARIGAGEDEYWSTKGYTEGGPIPKPKMSYTALWAVVGVVALILCWNLATPIIRGVAEKKAEIQATISEVRKTSDAGNRSGGVTNSSVATQPSASEAVAMAQEASLPLSSSFNWWDIVSDYWLLFIPLAFLSVWLLAKHRNVGGAIAVMVLMALAYYGLQSATTARASGNEGQGAGIPAVGEFKESFDILEQGRFVNGTMPADAYEWKPVKDSQGVPFEKVGNEVLVVNPKEIDVRIDNRRITEPGGRSLNGHGTLQVRVNDVKLEGRQICLENIDSYNGEVLMNYPKCVGQVYVRVKGPDDPAERVKLYKGGIRFTIRRIPQG